MDDVATCFDYYADLAEKLDSRQYNSVDVGMEEFNVRVRREPLGAVALITPWNYPLLMATWKVAPALAAGNCCVLKPSEMASVTCLELAELAAQAGLPAGVLNVITGLGQDAGASLSSHPAVAKVAFTGSTVTGKRVAQAAIANLRPATMELGGKSCLIIFDDSDLDKAVEWVMFGAFWTNGQICSSTSRILVQERWVIRLGIGEQTNIQSNYCLWQQLLRQCSATRPAECTGLSCTDQNAQRYCTFHKHSTQDIQHCSTSLPAC
eukprot:GHRR01016842.1.p1 GENE.GHRR01016842.1~~GHRR01016842.1.p1  ORF type:complete len:273 (+),score=58.34 GHRR01016842.1:26-820(+)